MEKLKQRLDMGWKLMVRNLKQVRQEHVAYFNKKARNRNLILGDKVLLSLQVTNKMKIAWQGSFSVVKQISHTNYRIYIRLKLRFPTQLCSGSITNEQ